MPMTTQELDHLAFSILHGTFDREPIGGCGCMTCTILLNRIREIAHEEAAEFYNEHYPPPGGFL